MLKMFSPVDSITGMINGFLAANLIIEQVRINVLGIGTADARTMELDIESTGRRTSNTIRDAYRSCFDMARPSPPKQCRRKGYARLRLAASGPCGNYGRQLLLIHSGFPGSCADRMSFRGFQQHVQSSGTRQRAGFELL